MEAETEVKKDADESCPVCKGNGWHWGWDEYNDPRMLRCPCVDRIRKQRQS